MKWKGNIKLEITQIKKHQSNIQPKVKCPLICVRVTNEAGLPENYRNTLIYCIDLRPHTLVFDQGSVS